MLVIKNATYNEIETTLSIAKDSGTTNVGLQMSAVDVYGILDIYIIGVLVGVNESVISRRICKGVRLDDGVLSASSVVFDSGDEDQVTLAQTTGSGTIITLQFMNSYVDYAFFGRLVIRLLGSNGVMSFVS